MKKILLLVIIISTTILSTSCSKSDDAPNAYKGNWSGSLSGDLTGTWTGSISSNGNFSGNVITTQSSPEHDFALSGKVSENGNLIATMKNSTYSITITFIGTFQTNLCNGTWVFDGALMEGTWNGTKQ